MEKETTTIQTRTHRMANALYERVAAEANKTGNAINNEINSLILDGLRFREATVIVHLQEK